MSERDMLVPLTQWLTRLRRMNDRAVGVAELPWMGRRVDLAVLSPSGRTTAFELKLRNTKKAIEQAARNCLSFDRSYVVTQARPSPVNMSLAAQLGVGIIVMRGAEARQIVPANRNQPHAVVARRLHEQIQRQIGSTRCLMPASPTI